MNGKQVAVLCSVTAAVGGAAWACSVGSPVVYGAAPGSVSNIAQTILGLITSGGGIISTIVLVLKKFGVAVPDDASKMVEKMVEDYRKGKMIDIAEDTVLISAMTFRVKAKDPKGIELATQLMQHVMVNGAKPVEPVK